MDRNLAARDIANRMNRMGYKPGPLKAREITKWREKMMESSPQDLAVKRYRLALNWVKDLAPAKGAAFLLSNLPEIHPGNFPKAGQTPDGSTGAR